MKAKTLNHTPNSIVLIKNQVTNLNNAALQTTEKLVDNTLNIAQQWQNLFAKAMKGGVTLLSKQQDMTLSTLEAIKGHILSSGKRTKDLVSSQKEAAVK